MDSATFLVILAMVAGGFGTALKMMHADMTKRAERAEAALELERKERAAERAAMQTTIDGYRDRTPHILELIETYMAHTEQTARAEPLPQRNRARIRPREKARA
jgi:hypothetical protein